MAIGIPPEIIRIDPMDLVSPIHPLSLSGFESAYFPAEVAGRYFFFTRYQTHSVVIVDMEHAGGATVVGTINNHVITDVTFHDGRLYASSLGRLTVWSIDDPTEPELLGEAPARGEWIEQMGEYLVCGWHETPDYVPGGMISVLRLDSPNAPKLIHHVLIPWEPMNAVEMGTSLYNATGTGVLHFGADEMGYLATRDLMGVGVNSTGLFGVTREGLFPLPRDDEDVLSNEDPIPHPDEYMTVGDCRIVAAAPKQGF